MPSVLASSSKSYERTLPSAATVTLRCSVPPSHHGRSAFLSPVCILCQSNFSVPLSRAKYNSALSPVNTPCAALLGSSPSQGSVSQRRNVKTSRKLYKAGSIRRKGDTAINMHRGPGESSGKRASGDCGTQKRTRGTTTLRRRCRPGKQPGLVE